MERIAVISVILENPEQSQHRFNDCIAEFKGIVKGRMGLPMPEHTLTVIAITLLGSLDAINTLTGRLGRIPHVQVKTAISKKEIAHELDS
jgi:putative iron-only hydrogenase system regulator